MKQALQDLGLPDNLVAEIEGRLHSQQQLLGKIAGVMCPPLFGCRTNSQLCRVRGWDKSLPSRLLGAPPRRSWIKRLRRLGQEVLLPLWRYVASRSEATRSRWQWTWVGDDSVFKKYGGQLGLVGTCPTYDAVTITIVDEAEVDQHYLMCLDTSISSPRLMRAWKRRSWIECCVLALKHLLATEACQVHRDHSAFVRNMDWARLWTIHGHR